MAPRPTKLEKRRRILDAAREVFVQNGFAQTPMSLVAERAGVGKGTLYEYFSSKEDLFAHLVVTACRDSLETLSSAGGQDDDPVQVLRDAIGFIVNVALRENLDIYRLFYDFWGVSLRHRLEAQKKLREVEGAFRGFMMALLRRGQDAGSIRPDVDPELWMTGLMAAVDGISLRLIVLGLPLDLDEYARFLNALFVDGLLAEGRLRGASILHERHK